MYLQYTLSTVRFVNGLLVKLDTVLSRKVTTLVVSSNSIVYVYLQQQSWKQHDAVKVSQTKL